MTDNFPIYYVVAPCALLSLAVHPSTHHFIVNRIGWAFCVCLEAVSVLPQLRLIQNVKIVEPFTTHYVFALRVARFLSCAHWVLQVLDSRGQLLTTSGYGLWPTGQVWFFSQKLCRPSYLQIFNTTMSKVSLMDNLLCVYLLEWFKLLAAIALDQHIVFTLLRASLVQGCKSEISATLHPQTQNFPLVHLKIEM